jgi:hypothetical protein
VRGGSTEIYVTGNEVTYGGSAYIALTPSGPTDNPPSANPTAWALVGGNATEIQGVPVNSTAPTHNGELLIYDSASGTYIPGDPLVQGLLAEGSTATGLNPVLISGKGPDGNQHDIRLDSTNAIQVNTEE